MNCNYHEQALQFLKSALNASVITYAFFESDPLITSLQFYPKSSMITLHSKEEFINSFVSPEHREELLQLIH